jgi:hypothetical protein
MTSLISRAKRDRAASIEWISPSANVHGIGNRSTKIRPRPPNVDRTNSGS